MPAPPIEAEDVMIGLPAIARFIARLWRTRARSRRKVSTRHLRRWLRRGLPLERFLNGPWMAVPSEVTAWWRAQFAREIAASLERNRKVDERKAARQSEARTLAIAV